jgi:hypothetical protein
MWHVWGKGEAHIAFWWGHLREMHHLDNLRIEGRLILAWILKHCIESAWTVLIWLRIGRSVVAG